LPVNDLYELLNCEIIHRAVLFLDIMTRQDAVSRIQWGQVAKWSKLDLSNMGLVEIPEEIENLAFLVKLDLSRNRLDSIGPILRLSAITKLTLAHNELRELPEALSEFTVLRVLNVSRNLFTKFPMVICQLSGLRELYIAHNKISSLPLALGNVAGLESLNVSHNVLNFVPGTNSDDRNTSADLRFSPH
jgi:leucine-rich repeat protein SHOC2